jgi:hypothetical protein
MEMTGAVHYRELASELYEATASASNARLCELFASLARQYEQLADGIEPTSASD